MMEEKFTYFWGGPFSQWHPCKFTMTIDGKPIEFNCAEQYMMYMKARLFKDDGAMAQILLETSSREQKALGRKVKNFDKAVWEKEARFIVFEGNCAKFYQNPDLKKKLMATKGTTLVEASPKDTIWGIGLVADDPRAKNKNTWLGLNWLGQALTDARDWMVLQKAE